MADRRYAPITSCVRVVHTVTWRVWISSRLNVGSWCTHGIQQLLVREGDRDCVLDKFRKVPARASISARRSFRWSRANPSCRSSRHAPPTPADRWPIAVAGLEDSSQGVVRAWSAVGDSTRARSSSTEIELARGYRDEGLPRPVVDCVAPASCIDCAMPYRWRISQRMLTLAPCAPSRAWRARHPHRLSRGSRRASTTKLTVELGCAPSPSR